MKIKRSCLPITCLPSILIISSFFWLSCAMELTGQVSTPAAESAENPNGSPKEDFTIRVAVEEVRIDAVVVDRRGRQITDLTTDDFELYQDGKRQKILSAAYVNEYQPQPRRSTAARNSPKAPLLASGAMLSRDQVRRTIVFVVDDLSMNFEHLNYTRMSLEKFVESQMQPGDLVSIIRTGAGIGAFQLFCSEKQPLLSAIRDIRWGASQALANCGPGG